MSSYMLWLQKEGRAAIKLANPEATFGEIGKLAGNEWRNLSPARKQEYIDAAEELKKKAVAESEAKKAAAAGGGGGGGDDDGEDEEDDDDDDDE